MSAQKHIGERLKELREARGLSLRALGQTVGVSHAAIHQIERGDSGASLDRIEQIAEALGASLIVEVAGEDDPHGERVARLARLLPRAQDTLVETLDLWLDMWEREQAAT